MRMAFVPLLALTASLAWAAPATSPTATLPPPVRHALEGIRPEALRAHMRFLADDRLEGRATGTRGYELAAAYMATEFEAAGLEPAGGNGTWYQEVPFRRLERDPDRGGLALVRDGREKPLVRDADYILGNDAAHDQASVTASLAFAGFGITAPELRYDDYAHVDVKGKIVVLLSGGPPGFPSEKRAYYSSTLMKTRTAVARGAVGILTVRTPGD
jgi:hypothetical protein